MTYTISLLEIVKRIVLYQEDDSKEIETKAFFK